MEQAEISTTRLPGLKVKGLGWGDSGEIQEFEKARYFPYGPDLIIVVEDEVIWSYDDLLRLLNMGRIKGKEVLEVVILPIIIGG